ncbi:MAG: transposase [Terriglobia bacterium]
MTNETEATAYASIYQIKRICQDVDRGIDSEFSEIFSQERTRKKAWDYVDGLANPYLENKTTWGISEYKGYGNPGPLQSLIGENAWSWQRAWDITAVMAGKMAKRSAGSDRLGVGILFDETADVKRGRMTCGVSYQHAGCAGGVANCTTWVMASLVGGTVKTWAASGLFLAEKEWFTGDGAKGTARRKSAGIPKRNRFATKPVIALRQLRRIRKLLRKNGIKLHHGGGDEVYGRFGQLLKDHEKNSEAYAYFVPRDKRAELRKGMTVRADSLLELADGHWERRRSGDGLKGPLYYGWAMIGLSSGRHYLLLRRPLPGDRRQLAEEAEDRRKADPGKSGPAAQATPRKGSGEPETDRVKEEMITFCLCYVPPRSPIAPTLGNLVAMTGSRWSAEETNETGKGPIGWDENHFRKWDSMNKHTALAGIAMLKSNMILEYLDTLGKKETGTAPPGLQEPGPPVYAENPGPPEQDYGKEDLMVPLGDSAIPAGPDDHVPENIGFIRLSRDEALRIREIAISGMSEAEMAFHLRCSKWRRRHQAVARWHHRKARMKAMLEPAAQSPPRAPAAHRDIGRKQRPPAARSVA